MALLPVAEAQARLLALAPALPIEHVPLAEAHGRWAAEDVRALRTQPAADLSAMDGYAIRYDERPGPWRVVGESAAGRPYPSALASGEAVRIFTGAALPIGADSVLVQEEAGRDGNTLRQDGEGPKRRGGNVRPRGLDFAEGDVLIARGERLTPARIAVAAVGGHAMLPGYRPVRVALAATGDELVRPGESTPDALPESNTVMLAAMLAGLPVEIVSLGILPDRLDVLTRAFADVSADVLVTTGGASVGDHDLVQPALRAAGATIDFWRIALRPGKPMMAGRMRDTVVVGLPGNPVSAFVTAELFVKPLIASMAGASHPYPTPIAVPLGEALPANGERTDYLRSELRDGRAYASTIQDSSMLRTLARSTCLIVREPHAAAAVAGDSAEILVLA
jgi:molybdopterin molybdotransferase